MHVDAKGSEEERKLMKFLDDNIPKNIHPVDLVDNTVHLKLQVSNLLSISDADSTITIRVRLDYEYTVKSATWKPESFGNAGRIMVSYDNQFWEPQFG